MDMTLTLRAGRHYLDRKGDVHGPMRWYSDKLGDRFEDQYFEDQYFEDQYFEDQYGDVYLIDGTNQHELELNLITECDHIGNPRREEGGYWSKLSEPSECATDKCHNGPIWRYSTPSLNLVSDYCAVCKIEIEQSMLIWLLHTRTKS